MAIHPRMNKMSGVSQQSQIFRWKDRTSPRWSVWMPEDTLNKFHGKLDKIPRSLIRAWMLENMFKISNQEIRKTSRACSKKNRKRNVFHHEKDPKKRSWNNLIFQRKRFAWEVLRSFYGLFHRLRRGVPTELINPSEISPIKCKKYLKKKRKEMKRMENLHRFQFLQIKMLKFQVATNELS